MIIEAEYQNGQLRWLQPIQFVHSQFRVKVEVPQDEVMGFIQPPAQQPPSLPPLSGEAAEIKRLTDALFGGDYRYVPGESDREILEQVLSEKYA